MITEHAHNSQARIEKQITASQENTLAIDILSDEVPLSKQKLKQAMEKGGVWLKKAKGGRRRLRRAKTLLQQGDTLELHYDAHILAAKAPIPTLISDRKDYSVWFKPEKMLSQGSKFADHCAITRWIEKNYQPKRAVYLVHRLDRSASGLILVAHNQQTAAKLSKLFSARNIIKRYTVEVVGEFKEGLPLEIDNSLDGKSAISKVLEAQPGGETSTLQVEIETGRKHQIRRHLSGIGWPVVGDSLYGDHTQRGALKLTASYLKFNCPISNAPVNFILDRPTLEKY